VSRFSSASAYLREDKPHRSARWQCARPCAVAYVLRGRPCGLQWSAAHGATDCALQARLATNRYRPRCTGRAYEGGEAGACVEGI
jgi:hypothetical protein